MLIVIYLAFISLGLPDSLLGAAWPAMYKSLAVPADFAGILSVIVAAGTVISSLYSARIIRRFGVAAVTTVSVFLTAAALLGFSYSNDFTFLCLLAVPLGLGAGSVDAALNNYVALHYNARHMNWLHCFWGLGAALGPMIMSRYLAAGMSWTKGYYVVGEMQLLLVIILLPAFPLWIMKKKAESTAGLKAAGTSFKTLLAIPGFKQNLVVFFCYCTVEATFGLWGASYLVFSRNFEPGMAAALVSVYYAGITSGRFLSGFVTAKLNNRQMVYIGQSVVILGLAVLWLPFRAVLLPAFFLVGLGCAPVFPALLHETPRNFGKKFSQDIMGIQMAAAYIGITLMPPVFGKIAAWWGYASLLWFLGAVLAIQVYMHYDLSRKTAGK